MSASDTSKTYLLSRTLLLLFPLYLVCFWIKLTRTNAVFSRIALVSSLCAETRLSGKYETNIYKVFLDQKNHGARRKSAEGPRGAHTCARRAPTLGRAWGVWPSRVPPGLLLRPEVAL